MGLFDASPEKWADLREDLKRDGQTRLGEEA